MTRKFHCIGLAALLPLGVAWTQAVAAPTQWFARVWQTDDGLPGNDVSGVVQTSDGWLWVATGSGLARFDGVRFSEMPTPMPSGRDQPIIRGLLRGQQDELWLALEGGVVMQPSPHGTRVFTSQDGLPLFRPMALAQTHDRAVWVSYSDGSVCRIREGRVNRFTARDGLGGVGSCWITSDVTGALWFGKAGQLGVWREDQFVPLHQLPGEPVRLTFAREGGVWVCADLTVFRCASQTNALIRLGTIPARRAGVEPAVLFEDRQGRLWVGTHADGLYVFEGSQFHKVNTSHEDILALGDDREGNLWVGTGGGGLNRVRPRLLDLQGTEDGLPLASIRSLTEDAEGVLWAVAQNGEVTRRRGERWNTVSTNDGWPGFRANCVLADAGGGVWIGTYRAGLHRLKDGQLASWQRSDGLEGDVIRGLFQDSRGDLWIALEGTVGLQRMRDGQFQTYSQPPGSRAIRALAEDARGQLWFGTMDGHLLRLEGDRLVDETPRTLAAPKPIRCLVATPDGSLWVGYAAAGLGRWRDGVFQRITTDQGLPDNYICAMALDEGGSWWLAADRGLFQVRHRELEAVATGEAASLVAVAYGRDEALPNLQANFGYAPGFSRSRDGRLWFPMRSGLLAVNPERTPPNRLPPPVIIEKLALDGRPLALSAARPLRLPPHHRRLEADITAFSFVAPEDILFRHWLEGWDEEWVENGAVRRIMYSRLPTGNYRLRVSARRPAGAWNTTEAGVAFVVEPFVWQTWWFRAGLLVLFTGSVVAAVRYASHRRLRARLLVLERETSLHKERARIAKDIHDDLGASLTQISLLGRLAEHDLPEPSRVSQHLKQISATARAGVKAVDEIVWAVNPRNDTVAHLLDYAGQYAVDFLSTAGIRCRVDFPEQIPPQVLPADARHGLFLVLKEALHNTVKHAGASEVRLQARLDQDQLMLLLEDNGRGFAHIPDNALSDGLRNMQQRLADLGGTCHIESLPAQGTRVTVSLPLSGSTAKAAAGSPLPS